MSDTADDIRDYFNRKLNETRKDRDTYREERDKLREELVRLSGSFKARITDYRLMLLQRGAQRIDGDLLGDIIADCCPPWMTNEAARVLAEQVVAELARDDNGVVVLRGTHNEVWTPDSEPQHTDTVAAPDTAHDEVVDATIWGPEWTEYVVYIVLLDGEESTITLLETTDETEAHEIARRVPGARVRCRHVHPEDWETVI